MYGLVNAMTQTVKKKDTIEELNHDHDVDALRGRSDFRALLDRFRSAR